MIIELFGPAGSGKTTFAHALGYHLQARGHVVKVALSYQPGVDSSAFDPGGLWYALRRVGRATIRTAAIAHRPFSHGDELRLTARLIRILPPRNPIWLIRFSQYILNLSVAWRQSVDTRQIVIFDQGFVQAVSSLVLFCRTGNAASLDEALDLIPNPELVINVGVSESLLSQRLRDRLFQQSYMERLFEADFKTNLQSVPIINRVKERLLSRGRSILSVDTSDGRSLQEALFRIEREVSKPSSDHRSAAADIVRRYASGGSSSS